MPPESNLGGCVEVPLFFSGRKVDGRQPAFDALVKFELPMPALEVICTRVHVPARPLPG